MNAGGKSAVMNALSLGLGGQAKATARGQNIADFIRRGNLYVRNLSSCSSASILV